MIMRINADENITCYKVTNEEKRIIEKFIDLSEIDDGLCNSYIKIDFINKNNIEVEEF